MRAIALMTFIPLENREPTVVRMHVKILEPLGVMLPICLGTKGDNQVLQPLANISVIY